MDPTDMTWDETHATSAAAAALTGLACALALQGCGCDDGGRPDSDDIWPDTDTEVADATGDEGDLGVDADLDTSWWFDVPGVEETCGNGIVDEGEECDDSNRMNGDGCDWQCMLGDGEPPDDSPDPDVLPLEPAGPEGTLVWGDVIPGPDSLSLQWNGEQHSTMYFYLHLDETEEAGIAFRRFDEAGVELPNEWDRVAAPGESPATVDHAWTGEEYAVFYGGRQLGGIWMARLSVTGKRLSEPRHVIDLPGASFPAVAWTGSAYGITWVDMPEDPGGTCLDVPKPSYFEMLGPTGDRLLGEPTLLHMGTVYPPRIAWGGDGAFRVATGVRKFEYPGPPACFTDIQERTVLEDGTVLETTNIGFGSYPDVAWSESAGEYIVAFDHSNIANEPFDGEGMYLARFSGAGNLLEAPYRIDDIRHVMLGARALAAPVGYAVLYGSFDDDPALFTLRLSRVDGRGRPVAMPALISPSAEFLNGVMAFDAAWAGEALAVVYGLTDWGMGDADGIFLQRYVPAIP